MSSRSVRMLAASVLLTSGFVVTGGVAEPLLPAAYAAAPKRCPEPARPFVPKSVVIPGVDKHTTVLALKRDRRNIPRTPPLSDRGKWQFAWDKPSNIRPGSRHGNVKMNAHTYPDGSALGNRLLRQLFKGQRIVVHGPDGQRLCYDVTRRIQVSGDRPYRPYYSTTGDPRLAILVCSGRRRGPGDWSHRTIWYASPVIR
ncbi:MAG: class F sortase [Actinomycetota bacterium]|nr:class F sortase [Actinomycetota bacterium]